MRAHERPTLVRPAGGLTHPIAILAIGVLVLNDHWWKLTHASWLTGKLSDVAGLVFFPLLLEAVVEIGLASTRRYHGPSRRTHFVTMLVTAIGFTWVKTTGSGHDAYGLLLGVARWPFLALHSAFVGRSMPQVDRPDVVRDVTDLVALCGLGLTSYVGWRRRGCTNLAEFPVTDE